MRHTDYSPLDVISILAKKQNLAQGGQIHSISYSLLPPGTFHVPEGWDCEFSGMYTGNFMCPLFHFIVPSLKDNSMDCYYQYYLDLYTQEDEERFHDLMVKAINAGIEQPQKTVGEICDSI